MIEFLEIQLLKVVMYQKKYGIYQKDPEVVLRKIQKIMYLMQELL